MPDLSKQPGNPTNYIHDNYQELMALAGRDPEAAAQQVIQAAESMVGSGLSSLNFRKLQMRAMQAAQRGVYAIQKYLSDYILSGSGAPVIAGRYQRENLEILGSLISEDIDYPPIEWTRELVAMKAIMEEYGLTIIREEQDEVGFQNLVDSVVKYIWSKYHYDMDNDTVSRFIKCHGVKKTLQMLQARFRR